MQSTSQQNRLHSIMWPLHYHYLWKEVAFGTVIFPNTRSQCFTRALLITINTLGWQRQQHITPAISQKAATTPRIQMLISAECFCATTLVDCQKSQDVSKRSAKIRPWPWGLTTTEGTCKHFWWWCVSWSSPSMYICTYGEPPPNHLRSEKIFLDEVHAFNLSGAQSNNHQDEGGVPSNP